MRRAIILAAVVLAGCATPQQREVSRFDRWCRSHSWNFASEEGRALDRACRRARAAVLARQMEPAPNVPASLKD